jgi:methyltransferase
MDLSVPPYLFLLTAVGAGRLMEMRLSRRNQQRLAAQGVVKVSEPHFCWMVLLHAGVLVGAALEVVLLRRPFIAMLGVPMALLFVLANGMRWWVIRTLAGHWNVQVMASAGLGAVTSGPYRWIRHPNYLAVYIEMVALPLIHTAWLTAIVAALGNAWVLARRVAVEDSVLLADPAYRAAMGAKPRFLPGLF